MSTSSRPESQRYESATNQFIYEGLVQAADESVHQRSPGKPDQDSVESKRRSRKPGAPATLAVDYSELCLHAEKLRFEKLELEQSNIVLRKYKKVYGHASQIQCSGCNEMFQPVPFKGHVLNCRFLEELEEQATVQEIDIQKMAVKVTQADNEGSIKFCLSYCGLSWYTTV